MIDCLDCIPALTVAAKALLVVNDLLFLLTGYAVARIIHA